MTKNGVSIDKSNQRLKEKEKVDINGEKSTQINIIAKNLKQATHYNYFVVCLCSYYATDLIQELELHLLVVIILFI